MNFKASLNDLHSDAKQYVAEYFRDDVGKVYDNIEKFVEEESATDNQIIAYLDDIESELSSACWEGIREFFAEHLLPRFYTDGDAIFEYLKSRFDIDELEDKLQADTAYESVSELTEDLESENSTNVENAIGAMLDIVYMMHIYVDYDTSYPIAEAIANEYASDVIVEAVDDLIADGILSKNFSW